MTRGLFVGVKAVVFACVFFLGWGWVALRVRRLDGVLGGALPAWTPAAGVIIGAFGLALAFWCLGLFVTKGRGTPAPFDPPVDLVAAGPYRRTRNPMYLGGLLVFVGLALVWRSSAVLAGAGAWWLLAHMFVVGIEEPMLRRKFGEGYDAYLREVPRWWPFGPAHR